MRASGGGARGRRREGQRQGAAPYTALEGERKLVTVLFADLKGSLELIADRDPEEARRLLDPVVEHMCEAVEKYGGTVSQVMGDGILALFGAPVSWEDHAVRACYAALSMQDLVRHYGDDIQRAYGVPVQIRIGLNSGEVVLNVSGRGLYMSYIAVGRTVHVAARMEQMAKPGSVLATAETVRLAEGYIDARMIGPVSVKGIERPVEVAEISRASAPRSRFDRAPVRAMTPFLGREAELAKLLEVFDDVALRRQGRIAIVVGEAGIGKSRLVHEFLRIVLRRDALALDGGGAPYSSGAGYRPGVHILRQYFNIGDIDDVKARPGEGRGTDSRARRRRERSRRSDPRADARAPGQSPLLRSAGRRAAPARVHRADVAGPPDGGRAPARARLRGSAMGDLRHARFSRCVCARDAAVHARAPHVPLRLRRELADGSRLRRDPAGRSRALRDAPDHLRSARRRSVARRAQGRAAAAVGRQSAVHRGVRSQHGRTPGELVGQPGHYRMGARRDATTIPPTVRAVLAARIDRLARLDKHVLQTLAAVGEVATVALLERVSDIPTDELRKSLRRLERAGLLVERIDREQLAYEFKHSLTQAVAYETLLHQRRRELHLGILVALRDTQEFDVLARHAEQGEAWDQALTYLREAGRITAQLGGLEAVSYFERALKVLEHLPPSAHTLETAFDLHCELRNALVPLGQHARLLEVLKAAEAACQEDRRRAAARAGLFVPQQLLRQRRALRPRARGRRALARA